MPSLGFHLCLHLKDGSVIARSARERRVLARIVLGLGRAAGLYCFALPDTHLHAGALCRELAPGELCRRLEISLTRRLGLTQGFAMYPPIPVLEQQHLERLVRYILTQHDRHQVLTDPFRESTNLPDLLGLRAIGGGYTLRNLHRLLPRLAPETLLGYLGSPGLRSDAATAPSSPTLLSRALVEATCRATALPGLTGSSPRVVAARRAALEIAAGQLTRRQMAPLLGVAPRTMSWLRKRPADPALVRAILGQVSLEAHFEESQGKATGAGLT